MPVQPSHSLTLPREIPMSASRAASDEMVQGEVCYNQRMGGLASEEALVGTYNYLDLAPKGRDEAELPWTMAGAASPRPIRRVSFLGFAKWRGSGPLEDSLVDGLADCGGEEWRIMS